jgi:hypothetical protein
LALSNLLTRILAIAIYPFFVFFFPTVATIHAKQLAQRLKVAPNNRFLMKEDGSPFFYLGDTAWELFHRARRDEVDKYLRDRAAKGFTVIQAVVLAEFDGLSTPNVYGHRALDNNDPATPSEDYFQHVDYIVDKAQKLGLYIGMLPTWGDKWNKKWGIGPEVFTPANAEKFGEFLGTRFKERPIIWILGGDRNPETDAHLSIIRALAQGIRKGDGGNHLMTYHPMGGSSSSTWFHKDLWLDFNMFQSGHSARDTPNHQFTSSNRQLNPPKPTLDGEPRYEDHPIDWKPEKGWFDDFDVRQAAYWSLLAGACGHTYGNHNVWQLWQPGREAISAARTPWLKALSHPGSIQMGYLRRLFESRPFMKLVPDQGIIVNEVGTGGDHMRAARAEDGSFAFIYIPTGKMVAVAMNKIKGRRVKVHWYNPRKGLSTEIGIFSGSGIEEFRPPTSGRGNDWVLVLDNTTRKFAPPGNKITKSAALGSLANSW